MQAMEVTITTNKLPCLDWHGEVGKPGWPHDKTGSWTSPGRKTARRQDKEDHKMDGISPGVLGPHKYLCTVFCRFLVVAWCLVPSPSHFIWIYTR